MKFDIHMLLVKIGCF